MKNQFIKNTALLILSTLILSSCATRATTSSLGKTQSTSENIVSTTTASFGETISVPESYGEAEGGGAAYNHTGDHADSIYYQHPDFYNMTNTDSLTILPTFKTYQQTTEVTCGPASALMVLEHYGDTEYDELEIAEIMETHLDKNGTNTENPGVADEQGEYGTSTTGMVQFFDSIGWNVSSSLTPVNEDGSSFDSPSAFQTWVTTNLSSNTPIMIEWIDWMGHWQVIIGYDTMGTEGTGDDVLILADPYDTSDHWQDGYYTVPAERFFYMWEDKRILPEDQQIQQWVIATPPTEE